MMRPLSASELLTTWERGLTQSPVERALSLLAAARPDTPLTALSALSIGQRDAQLLRLREWTFGPQLVSATTCPRCGEQLELNFNVADIRAEAHAESGELLSLSADGYETQFRLPNSDDLRAITDSSDSMTGRSRLLARCVLAVQHQGDTVSAEQLPAHITDAIVARMAQADPQADVQLALTCPLCSHQWYAAFDVVAFFWSEINHWAQRILREVHTLASAYGWHEADILALSPWRRQAYLELLNGS